MRTTAVLKAVVRWVYSDTGDSYRETLSERIDWVRVVPFIGVHLATLGVFFVGFSWAALWLCLGLLALRMFWITGFYHRYFAHKSFKTSRPVQFILAALGATCMQRGPLWWAAHHRKHHLTADQPGDLHSPREKGFWYSHMGWFLSPKGYATDERRINDLKKYPELRFIDRFDILIPVLFAVALHQAGAWMDVHTGIEITGLQALFWGFFLSTILLFHVSVTINSFAHRYGSRRYDTDDDSRNNWLLALFTFGEGWHNNHHHFPGSARQGFYWWEIDVTWYGLKMMSWMGLIWDLKPVPAAIRDKRRIKA